MTSYQAVPLAQGGFREIVDAPEQRILSDAVRRIAGYLSERALMGELQATVALSLLSELRGRTPDGDAEDGKLVVVMDDREGWSD